MTDDFAETMKKHLSDCAATLAEQNESWSRAKKAFAELDKNLLVAADADLLEELDEACAARRSPATTQILGAIRA